MSLESTCGVTLTTPALALYLAVYDLTRAVVLSQWSVVPVLPWLLTYQFAYGGGNFFAICGPYHVAWPSVFRLLVDSWGSRIQKRCPWRAWHAPTYTRKRFPVNRCLSPHPALKISHWISRLASRTRWIMKGLLHKIQWRRCCLEVCQPNDVFCWCLLVLVLVLVMGSIRQIHSRWSR